MPKALITSISGFTGKHLANKLRMSGYEVFGTVHGRAMLGEHEFHLDLRDLAAVRRVVKQVKPDVVVHLAAISSVVHGDTEGIYGTNVVGARNILQALDECSKIPKIVLLASSANVYGNSSDQPITEETPPNPANDYAVSKLAMEYMASLWVTKLPIVIVRPFNYSGIGQGTHFILPKIVEAFRQRAQSVELGNLDVARDFSDVRWVVEVYRKLIESAPSGELYNICSGSAYSLGDVLSTMTSITGHHLDVTINQDFVRENEIKYLCGSNRKLFSLIGRVAPIPIDQTLHWMYEGV